MKAGRDISNSSLRRLAWVLIKDSNNDATTDTSFKTPDGFVFIRRVVQPTP